MYKKKLPSASVDVFTKRQQCYNDSTMATREGRIYVHKEMLANTRLASPTHSRYCHKKA